MAAIARPFSRKTDGPPGPPGVQSGDGLNRGLKWSLIGHLGVAIFIMIKSLVFPGEVVPYVPTLRVDIVGLPDILKKDLKDVPSSVASNQKAPSTDEMQKALEKAEDDAQNIKPIKPQDVPEKPVAPDEMVVKPKIKPTSAAPTKPKEDRSKRLKSALDRIKALDKIGAHESDDAKPSRTGGVVIKGNKVSKGTSLSGEAREAAEAGYLDLLRDRLQANWALPVWLERQKLTAQVQLFIDAYGRVRGMQFVRGSGNAQFDDQVRRTIAQSQPFPAPPEGIAASLMSAGILVGFPL